MFVDREQLIFEISIPGKPNPKGRPRRGRYGGVYTPKDTRQWETMAKTMIRLQWRKSPLDGPLYVSITACYAIPQSWSKKKRSTPPERTAKPDLDNIIKSALDAMNGVVYKDDSQVCKIVAEKRYSTIACLDIRVYKAENAI